MSNVLSRFDIIPWAYFFHEDSKKIIFSCAKALCQMSCFQVNEEIFRSQVFFPCHFSRKPRCRCRASLILPARTQTYATRPGYLPTEQYCNLSQGLFIWARLTGLARLPGWILLWVHMRNFSPVSEMRKGQRSWERVLAPNSGNKANMAKHKNFNFRAYLTIGNS